jgi:hypothetical protein
MVTQAVIDMIVEWERQTGQRIKTLRTDHGTEDRVYQAIQWSLLAWKEKVIANTVKNCWRKSGLLPDSVLDPTAAVPAAPLQRQTSAEADDLEAAPLEDAADSMAEPALQELCRVCERWLSSVACCLKGRTPRLRKKLLSSMGRVKYFQS